ncbi:MAG: hypothetical protein IJH17_08470, partial [Clostridia bacterium]|nr:hypothetical protein [Clostridia bacterium]
DEYIDKVRKPYIRPNEFKNLKGREYEAQQRLKRYINKYKKAKSKQHIKVNQILCRYSTLQYFEEYIETSWGLFGVYLGFICARSYKIL